MKHKGTICIETNRLILRLPRESDYDNLFTTSFGNKEVCDKAGWLFFSTKEDMIEHSKTFNDKIQGSLDIYAWTIFLKETNIPIGGIGVHSQDDIALNCQIGYSIHQDYCNQGYATEALKKVLEFLINEVGYNRVSAKYRGNNIASGRVMEKAGMIFEGIERESYHKNGIFLDRHVYSILKKDL